MTNCWNKLDSSPIWKLHALAAAVLHLLISLEESQRLPEVFPFSLGEFSLLVVSGSFILQILIFRKQFLADSVCRLKQDIKVSLAVLDLSVNKV
jgi:hypothetical protein